MISDAELNEMDLETINNEIKSREDLLDKMVGTLYPSIVKDELAQLLYRKYDLLFPKKAGEND